MKYVPGQMLIGSETQKDELLNHIRSMKHYFPDHIVMILHFDFEGWCTRFTNDNVKDIAVKID